MDIYRYIANILFSPPMQGLADFRFQPFKVGPCTERVDKLLFYKHDKYHKFLIGSGF